MKQKLSKLFASSAAVIIIFSFTSCSNSPTNQEKENQVITSLMIPGIYVTGSQLSQDFLKYDSLEIDVDTVSNPTNPATYHVYGYYQSATGVKITDNITSHFPAQGSPITVSGGFTVMPIKCLGKGGPQPNQNQQHYYLIPLRLSVNGAWYLAFNINTVAYGIPGGSTLKIMNPCPPDHPQLQ
jgi:hypothetical protein